MLSIIIPFKFRADHYKNLNLVLDQIKNFVKIDHEIIIAEHVIDQETKIDFNIKHLKFRFKNDVFNKSVLINKAVQESRFENLMIWDADILFENATSISNLPELFKIADFIKPFSKMLDIKEDYKLEERLNINICSACFLIKKSVFIKCGGFDTRFKNWGGEETAFAFLINKLVEPEKIIMVEGNIYHNYHKKNDVHNFNNHNNDLLNSILIMNDIEIVNYVKLLKTHNNF